MRLRVYVHKIRNMIFFLPPRGGAVALSGDSKGDARTSKRVDEWLGVRGAGDCIGFSSCFAAEAAEPGVETTEKAAKKIPENVSPVAM